MPYINLEVEYDLDDLARLLAHKCHYNDLLDFIALLDFRVDDLVFTKRLRDYLDRVIREEEELDEE